MQLQQLLTRAETFAPLTLAEPWDKVGLQIGDAESDVTGALLCIDVTPAVVDEAVKRGAQLIMAYHPPIFEPLKSLTPTTFKQQALIKAIENRIAIYSAHTALDACPGGVNDRLAQRLVEAKHWGKGAQGTAAVGATIRPIRPHRPAPSAEFKVVVFVPRSHVSALRDAMADAGAGIIGEYTKCSFNLTGTGTFLGNQKSNPVLGTSGIFETVEETRIEMVCPGWALSRVAQVIRKLHPYEEPAFDIYRLETRPSVETPLAAGQGRLIHLDAPISPETLVKRVKKALGLKFVDVGVPPGLTALDSIGLCAGAGGSLLSEAPGVQAFITGEMRHHDALDAVQRGVMLILCGHTQTERPFLALYQEQLRGLWAEAKVEVWVSEADVAPTGIV